MADGQSIKKRKKSKKKKRGWADDPPSGSSPRRDPVERAVALRSKPIARRLLSQSAKDASSKRVQVRDGVCGSAGVPHLPERWNDDDCKKVIQSLGNDWKSVHAALRSDTTALHQLVAYRKKVVDDLIEKKRAKYPGLVASSVGSSDLTSDYDVTLGVQGGSPGDDVKVVRELNAEIKQMFGKQPGSVFDTNFYTGNFGAVRENIAPKAHPGEIVPTDQGATGPAAAAEQDVLSLLKQRRFMDQAEWDAHAGSVMGRITDPALHDEAQRRYENADAVYKVAARELLDRTGDPATLVSLSAEEEAMVSAQPAELRDQAREELLLSRKLHVLDTFAADRVMEKSNDLYGDHMQRVAELRVSLAALSDQGSAEAESLRRDIETETGTALFFASEAYHTKGTILHVVGGLQGKDTALLASLTPDEVLHSANEQTGDFLKDIRHYTGEGADDGVTFARSSKYLSRLFGAVDLLKQKGALGELDFERQVGASIASLKEGIEAVLLPARKGQTDLTPAENQELSRDAVWNMFQALTAEELKREVISLVEEVNAKLRGAPLPAQA